jgi:hypothetical protein
MEGSSLLTQAACGELLLIRLANQAGPKVSPVSEETCLQEIRGGWSATFVLMEGGSVL